MVEHSKYTIFFSYVIIGIIEIFSLTIVFFMGPFFWIQASFAHELDVCTLRIQGLASKRELAQLAVAEARVSDEDTLRQFVCVLAEIAERHSVGELVESFDLWSRG